MKKSDLFPFSFTVPVVLILALSLIHSGGYSTGEKKSVQQVNSVHLNKTKVHYIVKNATGAVGDKAFKMKNKKKSIINFQVEKYFLKNGMTVLLHQDQRIPQIYHQLLVKVGSKDEEEGKTGLAHLFEHMMFKGTEKYTGEEYEEKLESIGARNNAFTSRDYTAYEVILPSHKLEMVLEMEAERLKTLQLTQSNFDKEREVVKEERRMSTDNNPNDFFEPIMNLLFSAHPYGRPVIGWMKDLEVMTLEDCKKFYKSYYAPNNSVLIITGDFNIKETKKWIQKYYGVLKPSQINSSVSNHKQAKTKKKKVKIKRAIHAPTLAFAYKGPKAGEDGTYSLGVLNRILVSGESSRLHQLLVYKHKLALSVGGFYYDLKDEGVFFIFIKMVPDGDLKKIKQLFLSEMKKVHLTEVSKKELLKSTRSIMNEYVSTVKSLSGKANALSVNEAYFEDYKELFRDLERYEKVTAQTIKTQANLYLSPEQIFEVALLPNDDRQ